MCVCVCVCVWWVGGSGGVSQFVKNGKFGLKIFFSGNVE